MLLTAALWFLAHLHKLTETNIFNFTPLLLLFSALKVDPGLQNISFPHILVYNLPHCSRCSQSVSNSWQTVANHVKSTLYTVRGLRPNTIYLFMVRAINSQGLSDPSPMSDPVRTQGKGHARGSG